MCEIKLKENKIAFNYVYRGLMKRICKNNSISYSDSIELSHIKYNKDVNKNYQYNITRSCICDGTLWFIQDLIDRIIEDVVNQRTYYKPTFPEEKNIKQICYEVGDFIILDEFGDFNKNKPYLKTRFTVKLPVRCFYIK